jgi:hypothetical protein
VKQGTLVENHLAVWNVAENFFQVAIQIVQNTGSTAYSPAAFFKITSCEFGFQNPVSGIKTISGIKAKTGSQFESANRAGGS